MSPVHMVQGDPAPAPMYAAQKAAQPDLTAATRQDAATAPVTPGGAPQAAATADAASPAPTDTVTISPEAAKAQQGQAKPAPAPHATYHPSRRAK